MIKALLHKKLKDSFENPRFTPSEDSFTSSVIGLLQYLPNDVFWSILRRSCGDVSTLNVDAGQLISIDFWKKFSSDKRYNAVYVEPDVYCEFENFNLIIEAKKGDEIGQDIVQWEREITAYLNEQEAEDPKELIFIALGGNESLLKKTITIDNKNHAIHSASWLRLLSEVEKYRSKLIGDYSNPEYRILTDIIFMFEKHRYYNLSWLEKLPAIHIDNQAMKVINKWSFDNKPLLYNIVDYSNNNPINASKFTFNVNQLSLWKKI